MHKPLDVYHMFYNSREQIKQFIEIFFDTILTEVNSKGGFFFQLSS